MKPERKLNPQCRKRSHLWDNGPKPGSRCLRPDCLAAWKGQPGRNYPTPAAPTPTPAANPVTPAAPPSQPGPSSAARAMNDQLRARWGLQAPTAAAPAAQDLPTVALVQTSTPAPKVTTKVNIAKFLRTNAPDFVTMVPAKVVGWSGRIPNEPDPDMMAELRECTDKIIDTQLPKMEMNPWVGLLLISVGLGLQMAWSAEKVKKPDPRVATTPAGGDPSAGDTGQTRDSDPSLQSSSLTPSLSLVHDAGVVTNVPTS